MINFLCSGAKCGLWSNGFARNGVAVMVCVAVGGFHPLVKYQWYKDGECMDDAVHPVVYVGVPGEYRCEVTGEGIFEWRDFQVTGMQSDKLVHQFETTS